MSGGFLRNIESHRFEEEPRKASSLSFLRTNKTIKIGFLKKKVKKVKESQKDFWNERLITKEM